MLALAERTWRGKLVGRTEHRAQPLGTARTVSIMICSGRDRRMGQRQRAGGAILSADLAYADRAVGYSLFTWLAREMRSERVVSATRSCR